MNIASFLFVHPHGSGDIEFAMMHSAPLCFVYPSSLLFLICAIRYFDKSKLYFVCT